MKLKIVSDGTTVGTKVTDEDGKPVGLIQEIIWKVSVADAISSCTLVIAKVPLDVTTEVTRITYSGQSTTDVDELVAGVNSARQQ